MCYRFYIDLFFKRKFKYTAEDRGFIVPEKELARLADPRDVHPSETALVVAGSGTGYAIQAKAMSWGFASPVTRGLLANARSESMKEKPTFRESALLRRCVIPASGFYEWDANKARYRFYRTDELLWLAGIYRAENGLMKFTVLTRAAAGSMLGIHDRMPLTVEDHEVHRWIGDQEYADHIVKREPGYLIREQDAGQISMDFGI